MLALHELIYRDYNKEVDDLHEYMVWTHPRHGQLAPQPGRARIRVCHVGILIAALFLSAAVTAAPSKQIQRYQFDTNLLSEASGVAASRRNPQVLWSHNDSGDLPTLYALNTHGHYLGKVDILGANAFDWEDIAAFTHNGKPYLMIADVGDNFGIRPFVTLYILSEPDISQAGDNFCLQAKITRRIDLRFRDGPHDVEAAAVDAAHNAVYLLSKKDKPPVLYRVQLMPGDQEQPITAQPVTRIKTLPPVSQEALKEHPNFGRFRSQPSALDISAGGTVWLVTTYTRGYLYRRKPGQSLADMFSETPQPLPKPHLPQLEGGALSADLKQAYFMSERLPSQLVSVPLKLEQN